jgi:hypothetical protein
MISRVALIGIVALAIPTLAEAADAGEVRTTPKHSVHAKHAPFTTGPYPLSWRAAKIRRADRCWRRCVADIGSDFRACLRAHRPTDCVHWNAAADLRCLHACRLSGGPWVKVE